MTTTPFLLTAALLAVAPALAQNTVANYATGQPGTASYEHFSFWSHDGQRYNMQYSYGAGRRDSAVYYVGPVRRAGQSGFQVRFTTGQSFYLTPSGPTLLVATTPTAVPKVFTWEYEGPVNGVGTTCAVCTPDATAAWQLLLRYYL